MLEHRQSNISSAGDFDQARDKRAQIDTNLFLSLSRMIPRPTASIPVRIALRLEENFLRKPLREKLRFMRYALRWGIAQIHGRYFAKRRQPARAPTPGQVLRVAVHGTVHDNHHVI